MERALDYVTRVSAHDWEAHRSVIISDRYASVSIGAATWRT